MPDDFIDMRDRVEEKYDKSEVLLDDWLSYIHQVIEEEFCNLS